MTLRVIHGLFFFGCLALVVTCAPAQEVAAARDAGLVPVAREIMAAAHFATLITVDSTGHPRARVMDPFPPEDDMTVWLATNPKSRKVQQLARDARVTLLYFDSRGLGYVSLMGTGRLVDDSTEKATRWKDGWERFYPNRGEAYLLIEVTPTRLEVVSERHGLGGDPVTWAPDAVTFGTP